MHDLTAITSDINIPATDDFQLAATVYKPAETQSLNKTVILNSATGVKRTFYAHFARFLAEEGFAVVTFDYRGIGDSRPVTLNKFQAFMHDWGEKDIAGVIDWVGENFPGSDILAVGHSVGGQVMGVAHNNDRISAMLLVASQSGYWRLWPWHQKLFILIFWYLFIPGLTIPLSYFPAKVFGLGEDLPLGVALEWASWGRDPKYIIGENNRVSKQNFQRFTAPILSYSVASDFFAPKKAADELMTYYVNAQTTRRHLTPASLQVSEIGHFDFFRKPFKDPLWRECAAWLKAKGDTR